MTSRLDRLFLLLDTGSSVVTRKAAALQLGEVQKLHPHELHNLLNKVRQYLHSNSWETRIAASQAVEAIIKNVPQWNPPGIPVKREPSSDQSANALQVGRMKFSQFAIHKVMKHGGDLLASEGKEFDIGEDSVEMDIKEHMATQRQLLNKRLGLDVAERLGIDTNEIFSNEDLKMNPGSIQTPQSVSTKSLSEVFQSEVTPIMSSGNSREINKAKRQARFAAKQKSRDIDNGENNSMDGEEVSQHKKARLSGSVLVDTSCNDEALVIDTTHKSEHLWEEATDWPFESFCDELMQDLFNPLWEVRHGAATALREVVRLHGKGAGRTIDTPSDEMDLKNHLWLEDLALRLLCVLALDKFGDFISDQVVAPVRETCAQALGSILHIMTPAGVEGVLHVLLELLKRPEWEARHGGLLGLKYLLAVRKDMTSQVLPVVFQPVFQGLQDPVDDVSAVAAAALVPVKDALVQLLPDVVPTVVSSLWDALSELDDLTTSTSSILMLLASLLSYSQSNSLSKSLSELVPRLWPFLGHSSSNVRKSVLQALAILTSSNSCQPCETWLPPILSNALRLLYQRCLIEQKTEIQDLLYQVWYQMVTGSPLPVLLSAACPFLGSWLSLMMQPLKMPINPGGNNSWLEISHKPKEKGQTRGRKPSSSDHCHKEVQEMYYIGGNESLSESDIERERCATRARLLAAKFLGILSCYVTKPMPGVVYGPDVDSPLDCFAHLILFHLKSKSAVQRQAVAFLLIRWAEFEKDVVSPKTITDRCLECLGESVYYDEIAIAFTRMQQECRDFVSLLRYHKLPIDNFIPIGSVLTMEQASSLAGPLFTSLVNNARLKPKVLETLEDRRKLLLQTVNATSSNLVSLSTAVQASLAGALVSLHCIPEKLNPIIRPLMDSIKKEENEELQAASGKHLVQLMDLCVTRTPCPNPKIIKNLIGCLCIDSNFTPSVSCTQQSTSGSNSSSSNSESPDKSKGTANKSSPIYYGILTLVNMQKTAEKANFRRSNSLSSKRNASASDVQLDEGSAALDEVQKQNELQRRGATYCLTEAAKYFGVSLPQKLPQLWETMMQPLMDKSFLEANEPCSSSSSSSSPNNMCIAQSIINSLQVLEVIAPALSSDLHPMLVDIIPRVCCYLEHCYTAVRHMAARCLGVLSNVVTTETMDVVLDKVLGMVGTTDNSTKRQGAVESLFCIIDNLGLNIVPYIVLLVVPMLGRMSDQNDSVRLMATHCFASLIRLMPLEGGIKDPPKLRPELAERKARERYFLEQLTDCRKLENYKLPIPINAELRSYQQQGVNWLAFLNKYKLHGILCDDMGLGKTLQSICILASDHYYREQKYKETKRADCKPLPSLVICPPTLTGHWVYEVEKFVKSQYLNPLHYTGPPMERVRLRNKAKRHNLIIASYDIVRNDIDFFGSFHWNYCILDEGHIIKNGKTKLARAIKQLSANHRLILTGTPIQNNVLELWSLFDFLMPGFLGTEKQFTARYSKPILQSRDAKSSSKEQEAGVLAMESLHRQVLPFLLRRMKEDVLQDLPPKIIQDYYCDLSTLQAQLYEDFAKSQARRNLEESLKDDESVSVHSTSHIFQALQYLRKVCNHPKLVLSSQHPEHERIIAQLKQQNSNLADIQHAAKLSALRQLLQDCGIGTTPLTTAGGQAGPEPVVNQHRALVFCQLKSMLDIIEKDLFRTHMPSVTYLRLDGSIAPSMRHAVVHRFNNDPSIDVLLLTTQVGGLGLNLTGADTVIFVEHDWNPMKDLQAMDRAHRIGQKKVVNVYRLITRGTLEEKIMGLQKFKLSMANTVISQENSSLQTMGTEQLLDLFTLDDRKKGESLASTSAEEIKMPRGKGVKAVLESLPELWDAEQYETEYDLGNFMQSLSK